MSIKFGLASGARGPEGDADPPEPRDADLAHARVEERWSLFLRWGPYVLLGFTTVLLFATADFLLTGTGERIAAAALLAAALLLQLWWGHESRRHGSGPSAASAWYYLVRQGLAFALTWLNPFAAFYAVLGYFGAERQLPRRLVPWGLFATAATMAGSQSGGFPPRGNLWAVFGALLAAHLLLVYVFSQLASHEERRRSIQADTIAELARTNARLQQALDENAALHEQLLVQAREAGVADERRRLAAEIHDTIAQGLTGIIAQLQVVASTADRCLAREHLERAAGLARSSLGEARRSVHNLGPAALEHHALPEALKETTCEWSERTGIRTEFTITGTAAQLHEEIEGTLVRIAQEALSNAARHAAATRVGVTLSYMDDEVALDVRDDGTGFAPEAVPPRSRTGGFGLDGMRARAERVAGTVTVESERGHGTAVSARVPLVRHDQ